MQSIELKQEKQDFRTKEAFKTLRTNIEFSGENIKVICVTSCTPNEGKSSVSYELAKSFAQNGKKTILIDADLRKSVMRGRHKKGICKITFIGCNSGFAMYTRAIYSDVFTSWFTFCRSRIFA